MKVRNNKITYSLLYCAAVLLTSCLPLPSLDQENAVPDLEQTSSLMAHYTFEESCDDLTGNGYAGVEINSPDYLTDTPSGNGHSLKLNGFKNQSVSIPYSLFNDKMNYSISLWVKDFSLGVLFSAVNSTNETYSFPRLVATDSGTFKFIGHHDYSGGSYTDDFIYDYTAIQADGWHHIVITSAKKEDYSVTKKLYVDGKLVSTLESQWSEGQAHSMTIGGEVVENTPSVTAKLDNLRLYESTLSADEVNHLFKNYL